MRATLLGAFVDPFIEVCFGSINYRQYFERGVSGRRYLNLSPIFQAVQQRAPAVRVRLRGRSIAWGHAGTLELFDSPSIERATRLVLAPHPDDAEIAAFGIYSERLTWVATVTAGELGLPTASTPISSGPDGVRWAARIRVWDSLTVPQLGESRPNGASVWFSRRALEGNARSLGDIGGALGRRSLSGVAAFAKPAAGISERRPWLHMETSGRRNALALGKV